MGGSSEAVDSILCLEDQELVGSDFEASKKPIRFASRNHY